MKASSTRRTPRRSRISTSVRPESKRRLLRASRAQGRSMGAVLDEPIATMDEETLVPLRIGPGRGQAWLKENMGILAGKLKPADWERKDRFGDLLRKHVPR